MNGWLWYGVPGLQVCPYMPGCPVYRDGVLSALYYRTRDEAKIERVFCGDSLNHDQFISYFERRKTLQVLCRVEENKDLTPMGYSWIDSPKGVDGARSALIGFCFFREGRRVCVDLGRLGLAYMFEDLKIDTLHGVLLESNLPAVRYADRLGFEECGVVPDYHFHEGRLEGARVMYLRKREFWDRFVEWRERTE